LEKQSTNLCTYSENFSNAAWNLSVDSGCSLTITPNYTTASNGLPAARLVASRTNTSTLAVLVNYATNTGTSATKSIWMKNNNAGNVTIMFGDEAVTITDSWERYSVTNTYLYSIVGLRYSAVALTCDISITGSQFELGSYATSYIPTTAASATRVADFASVNLPNTNMTFCAYLECDEAPLGTTAGPWLTIENNSSNLGRGYGYSNTFGFAGDYALGVTSASKMVWKQESGTTAKLFKNGALAATSTTGTYSNPFNRFKIDGAYLDKPLKIKEFVFFDNNLTDAECAALTA
jgi:hypothetical protein